MTLRLCTECNQHIHETGACPYCAKPNNNRLSIPMALMLGIGCSRKEVTPSPEIMALYGGPPIELEEQEVNDSDTAAEPAPVEDTQEQSTPTPVEPTESTDSTNEEARSTESVEPEIQAAYGSPPTHGPEQLEP